MLLVVGDWWLGKKREAKNRKRTKGENIEYTIWRMYL